MHFSGRMDLILIRMSIRICMRLQEILFMERQTEMSQEEKYKLALFAVIRNSTVMRKASSWEKPCTK